MKTFFKTMPFALALLALASCSTDEMTSTKLENADGRLKVTTETQFDEVKTRSAIGYARITNGTRNGTRWGTYFVQGDELKVYGTESWKYQVWEYNDNDNDAQSAGALVTSYFDLKKVLDKEADSEKDEIFGFDKVGYCVYPADMAVFTNEERSKITIKNFIASNVENGENNGVIDLKDSEVSFPTPEEGISDTRSAGL